MIYKINLAFPFLDSGKNDLQKHASLSLFWAREIRLQNEPRSHISWLGKNSFTKSTSLSRFLAREKMIYKIIFFCYTTLSKGF